MTSIFALFSFHCLRCKCENRHFKVQVDSKKRRKVIILFPKTAISSVNEKHWLCQSTGSFKRFFPLRCDDDIGQAADVRVDAQLSTLLAINYRMFSFRVTNICGFFEQSGDFRKHQINKSCKTLHCQNTILRNRDSHAAECSLQFRIQHAHETQFVNLQQH